MGFEVAANPALFGVTHSWTWHDDAHTWILPGGAAESLIALCEDTLDLAGEEHLGFLDAALTKGYDQAELLKGQTTLQAVACPAGFDYETG